MARCRQIVDFGSRVLLETVARRPGAAHDRGTGARYADFIMSPERAQGFDSTHRTDLFALG